jgi:peroxiredoxin
MRTNAWLLLIYMSIFTLITFIVAISNPVSDCGCFGDALIITNWQTFWKNIIFFIPTLVIFSGRKRYRPFAVLGVEWGLGLLFMVFAIVLSICSYHNLPMLDFRPYKIGTHIPSAMEIPEDAVLDEYETIFIYSKDNQEQEFAVEDIPYQDTAWKYVDRKTNLIKKGYEPPIHDFTIATFEGVDITDSVLSNPAYTLLVVAYNLKKTDLDALNKVNDFAATFEKLGGSVYGMTASTTDQVKKTYSLTDLNFNFHTTDEITLKTIVRSNPGVVLVKDGVILNKWHYNNLPTPAELEKGILYTEVNYKYNKARGLTIGFMLVLLVSVLSVLTLLVKEGNK